MYTITKGLAQFIARVRILIVDRYSFLGGFKIQLLDSRGRHLQDLTPEGEWVGDRLTRHTVI